MSVIVEEAFNLGTKEYMIVDVTDLLGGLTDLAGANCKYDIRVRDDTSGFVVTAASASVVGMRAYCLVDTTVSGLDVVDFFEMFVYFDNLLESPRLGPIEFRTDS